MYDDYGDVYAFFHTSDFRLLYLQVLEGFLGIALTIFNRAQYGACFIRCFHI